MQWIWWRTYSVWIDRSHWGHYSVKRCIQISKVLILCKSICFITLSPEDKGEKLYKNQVPSGVSNNINMVLYGRMIKHQSCSFFLAWTEKDEQCLCSTGDNETRLAEIERSGHAQMLSKHFWAGYHTSKRNISIKSFLEDMHQKLPSSNRWCVKWDGILERKSRQHQSSCQCHKCFSMPKIA